MLIVGDKSEGQLSSGGSEVCRPHFASFKDRNNSALCVPRYKFCLSLSHTHTIMFGKRVFREGRDHVSSVPLDCLEDPKWDFDLLGYKKRNSFKTM
jgi:hypothetical protein